MVDGAWLVANKSTEVWMEGPAIEDYRCMVGYTDLVIGPQVGCCTMQ